MVVTHKSSVEALWLKGCTGELELWSMKKRPANTRTGTAAAKDSNTIKWTNRIFAHASRTPTAHKIFNQVTAERDPERAPSVSTTNQRIERRARTGSGGECWAS